MGKTTKPKKSRLGIPIQKAPDQRARPTFFDATAKEKLKEIEERKIRFSFLFFDRFSEQAFNCGGVEAGWFIALMDQLKAFSNLTLKEFRSNLSLRQTCRIHPLDWKNLNYKFHLPDGYFEQIESDCWQFAISKAKGRVHGFMFENTFYIVWLDPHHNLYPMERHGGTKLFDQPATPYEELKKENEKLRIEIQKLENDLLECWEKSG